MNKLLLGTCLVLALGACEKKEKPAPTALDVFVSEFSQEYKQASVDFGVTGVNPKSSVTTIDCMVFNQTSEQGLPTSLGKLAAMQQSLRIRLYVGCADNIPLGMAQYETARRQLKTLYDNTIANKTQSEQILIGQSNEAQFIKSLISDTANEVMSCRSNVAVSKRGTQARLQLDRTAHMCGAKQLSDSDYKQNCNQSWQNAQAHQTAQGVRDELSYMSELVSRYRSMFLSCYPQATHDYVAFHQTVPQQLFEGPAIRFKVPVDPVMQCGLQKLSALRNNGRSGKPIKEYLTCSREMGLQHLYVSYLMPDMFDSNTLQGKGKMGQWLINPQKMNLEPQRWQLNECQKTVAQYLTQHGYNLVQPEALANYCRRQDNKKK